MPFGAQPESLGAAWEARSHSFQGFDWFGLFKTPQNRLMRSIPDLSKTCFENLYLFVPGLRINPLVKMPFFCHYFGGPAGIARGRPGGSQPLLSECVLGFQKHRKIDLWAPFRTFQKRFLKICTFSSWVSKLTL